MTKPYAIQRLTFGGNISANQTWSVGISGTPVASVPTAAMLNAMAQSASAAFDAYWNSGALFGVGGLNPAATTFHETRASYTPAGSSTATVVGSFLKDVPNGGSASNSLPTQTALVVSLTTGLAGRSQRGRIYLPCTGYALSGHFVGSSDIDGLATKTVGFIQALNAIADTGYGFASVVAGKSATHPITGCRIDNRPDIQRRRADKVLPTHTAIGSLI